MTMATDEPEVSYTSFLGSGWSFPPEFVIETRTPRTGTLRMSEGERDIEESLRILFGTSIGERLFEPDYGLDMHEILFEPMSTTSRAFLIEREMLLLKLAPRWFWQHHVRQLARALLRRPNHVPLDLAWAEFHGAVVGPGRYFASRKKLRSLPPPTPTPPAMPANGTLPPRAATDFTPAKATAKTPEHA